MEYLNLFGIFITFFFSIAIALFVLTFAFLGGLDIFMFFNGKKTSFGSNFLRKAKLNWLAKQMDLNGSK